LHNLCDLFDVYTGTYSRRTSGYGAKIERCSIKTIYNIPSYFTNSDNLIRMSYTFTDEILRRLNPLALAIYYIDDGSKLPCQNDGNIYATNKHPRVTFATHRHKKEDVERFSRYLYERYLITNRVVKYQNCYDDGGYQIELDAEGTYKLFNLIAKYIPYDIRDKKLSKKWHSVPYEDWTKDVGEYKLIERKVERVVKGKDLKIGHTANRKMNRAYDIEVENNHTYFANGYAVHNCRAAFVGDRLMTRQGKEYTGLDHIIKDLNKYIGTEMFVDGELVYKNKEGLSDSEAFQKGTGIAMSKGTDKTDLKLVIFDMFPLDEFWQGQSKEPYSTRKERYIDPLFKKLRMNYEGGKSNISVVPMYYNGYDHSEIWKWLDYAEENDIEGVIINLDTPYECKRTKNLIKVKKFYTYDLEVVGVEEGDGRNKGTLGALVVRYKNNTVNVGSGFTDAERKSIWQNKDDIIGRVIEVKFKETTIDKKTGLESLQFPVYCGIRELGKEPSYN
jgi:hypothetical protein